jgi:hypothetical protein
MRLELDRRFSRAVLAMLVGVVLVTEGTYGRGAARSVEPTPVLWRDPGAVDPTALLWGPGGPDRAPVPPFRFVSEDMSGTKPKVEVTDARGTAWSVKFDHAEVPAEIAAGRIMWALGYLVDETYLVTDGVIDGVGALERASEAIGPAGRFKSARFERRPQGVERRSGWTIQENPFVGSKELSGLILAVALLNNWDFRPGNTAVLRITGAVEEDQYIVSDWGTAFGRMGSGLLDNRSRWNLEHFQEDTKFILRADDRIVELYYQADGPERARVPLEHARWFSGLASRLTDQHLRQAFVAAGASEHEVRGFSARLQARLAELRDATASRSSCP